MQETLNTSFTIALFSLFLQQKSDNIRIETPFLVIILEGGYKLKQTIFSFGEEILIYH